MGKRQIRSQEKHSEGRKIPYQAKIREGQDEKFWPFCVGKQKAGR